MADSGNNESFILDTSGFADVAESADARIILFSTGYILEVISERYGPEIQPSEIRQRTKSAADIITTQVGHDGCMAMEGYEVQDLLCRISGLFMELTQSMKRIDAKNASSLCSLLATRLIGFCGRMGGGDRRSYKQQVQHSATTHKADKPVHRPPSPGRMGAPVEQSIAFAEMDVPAAFLPEHEHGNVEPPVHH